MNTTSTHDTKRSEDVRARLNVLSELPGEWEKHLLRWRRWNQSLKQVVDGITVPTPGEEILLYQTLLGVWPLNPSEEESLLARLRNFVVKAVREAKIHSGWIRSNEAHENAMVCFLEAILAPAPTNLFRRDFLSFQERIARHGALNALSQVLIKITAPGIPDFYQGTELWAFCLVDPDNRCAVDFRRRAAMLDELRRAETQGLRQLLEEMTVDWKYGRIKLYLTDKALDFRRAHASLFLEGDYIPLATAGPAAPSVCAFGRSHDGSWSLTVAPRHVAQLAFSRTAPINRINWADTSVAVPDSAPDRWRNVLTGETLAVSPSASGPKVLTLRSVLRSFPVALLQGL